MVENTNGRYSGSSAAEADYGTFFFELESHHIMESRTRGVQYLYESFDIKSNSF